MVEPTAGTAVTRFNSVRTDDPRQISLSMDVIRSALFHSDADSLSESTPLGKYQNPVIKSND